MRRSDLQHRVERRHALRPQCLHARRQAVHDGGVIRRDGNRLLLLHLRQRERNRR